MDSSISNIGTSSVHWITVCVLALSLTISLFVAASCSSNNHNVVTDMITHTSDTDSDFSLASDDLLSENHIVTVREAAQGNNSTVEFSSWPLPVMSERLVSMVLSLSWCSILTLISIFVVSILIIVKFLQYLFQHPRLATNAMPANPKGFNCRSSLRFLDPPVITPEVAKRAATYPNPYPCGWFKLCYMDDMTELAVNEGGRRKYKEFKIQALGHSFIVNRTEAASAIFWSSSAPTFATSPSGLIPSNWPAYIHDEEGRPFHTSIRLGGVYVWWGKEGKRGDLAHTPEFELDFTPYFTDLVDENKYQFIGEGETVYSCYVNELAANSPDYAHFNILHGSLPIPVIGSIIKLRHAVSMHTAKEFAFPQHYCLFSEEVEFWLFGKWRIPSAPFGNSTAHVRFEGPGVVHFEFKTSFGSIHQVKTVTPIGPLKQLLLDQWYKDVRLSPRHAGMFVWVAPMALAQDQLVWENKRYNEKPIFSSADGPFGPFRMWYKQFC